MKFRFEPETKFRKLGLVLCVIFLLFGLMLVIAHFADLQIQYHTLTFNWEKALQVIDNQISSTNNELYRDQLHIYRLKILVSMAKAARVLCENSQMQLNDAEKIVYAKYLSLYKARSKECRGNLAQFEALAEKRLPLKLMVRLPSVEYSGEYKKLSETEADEFYRQLIGAYFYLELSLNEVFGLGRFIYVKGNFTPEGLAESALYTNLD